MRAILLPFCFICILSSFMLGNVAIKAIKTGEIIIRQGRLFPSKTIAKRPSQQFYNRVGFNIFGAIFLGGMALCVIFVPNTSLNKKK